MFEAFERLVRRVSSSMLCSEGLSRHFRRVRMPGQVSTGGAKRRYFQFIEDANPCQEHGGPHASSKPPARDADTREKAVPRRNELTARALRRCRSCTGS